MSPEQQMLIFFLLSSVALMLVTADEQLFGDTYRTDVDSIVSNPTFAGMTSPGSVTISYQGFAQVPSTSSMPSRLLFSVRPSSSNQYSLPTIFIADNTYLAANISTTTGSETFIGPRIQLDTWFAFGIAIVNGNPNARSILLYLSYMNSSSSITQQYSLKNNMLPSSTAVAVAPALSPSTHPVPVYITSLRVIGSALTQGGFDYYIWLNPSPTYFWQVGTALGVSGFKNTNVSCAGNGLIISVNEAYFGRPIGVWPNLNVNPSCNADSRVTMEAVTNACLNKNWCIIYQNTSDYGVDPCPGYIKYVAASMTCSTSANSSWTLPQIPSMSTNTMVPSSRSPSSTATRSSFVSSSSSPSNVTLPSPTSFSTSGVPISTFTDAPSTVTTWKRASNSNAWQLSLTIFLNTLGLSNTMSSSLVSAFINDMSSALNVPPSRFTLVEFQQQTTSSTLLSFVVLPNATDPDATAVVSSFLQQMQIPGSELRSGTLLVYSSNPPVPIQAIGLRVINCGGNSYVISPNACPTALLSFDSTATTNSTFYILIIAICLLAVAIAVVGGMYFWFRKKQIEAKYAGSGSQAMVAVPMNNFYPVHPSFVNMNGVYREGQIAMSPRAGNQHHMPSDPVALPSLNEMPTQPPSPRKLEPARKKRSRLERSPRGARVKFDLKDDRKEDSDFGTLS